MNSAYNTYSSCTAVFQNLHNLLPLFVHHIKLPFLLDDTTYLCSVLNCSISVTRMHLCWLDSLISHLSYVWNIDCRDGSKVLQLWKIHACRANCWCQVQHSILLKIYFLISCMWFFFLNYTEISTLYIFFSFYASLMWKYLKMDWQIVINSVNWPSVFPLTQFADGWKISTEDGG